MAKRNKSKAPMTRAEKFDRRVQQASWEIYAKVHTYDSLDSDRICQWIHQQISKLVQGFRKELDDSAARIRKLEKEGEL